MPSDPLATLLDVLSTSRVVFTRPGFEKFLVIAAGWILTQGPVHCVTEALVATDVARRRHWAAYHRFFSRGTWDPDRLGFWLLQRLRHLAPGHVLPVAIDDTLCPHKGPEVFGLGTHVDAVRSTRKHKVFAFGHCWVVLAVLVRVPFSTRTWALPLLFRLYRNKAEANEAYAKKTELARQMLEVVLGWTAAEGTTIVVTLDQGYANSTVLQARSPRVVVVGAMRPDAALTELPAPTDGTRSRKRGPRRPSPEQHARDVTQPWQQERACLYGEITKVAFKTCVAQWYKVTGEAALRVVVVRCDEGTIPYRVFFCTEPSWNVGVILETYACRWAQEVWFRDAKQYFGLADSPALCERAVRRVVPLIGLLSSLLVVWFAEVHTSPVVQVPVRPWYRHKKGLCFADLLRAARRTLEGVDVLTWDQISTTCARPSVGDPPPEVQRRAA